MKNYLSIFIAMILLTGISCEQQANIEKEKEAIVKVIWDGSNAYKERNLEKMAGTYVLDETAIKLRAAKTGYNIQKGWSEIEKGYATTFTNFPNPGTGKYEKLNFQIKIFRNSAWAIHDEIVETAVGGENIQTIVHFLEKYKGEWKVAYMSLLGVSSYKGIIGTWKLIEMKYITNGKLQYEFPNGNVTGDDIKMWTNNHFSFNGKFQMNNETVDNYGGGTYTLNGNFYEENIMYHATEDFVGQKVKMLIKIKNDTLTQTWPVDADGNIDKNNYSIEKYTRLD